MLHGLQRIHRQRQSSAGHERRRQRVAPAGIETLESRSMLAVTLALEGPTAAVVEGEPAMFVLALPQPMKTPQRVEVSLVAGTATLGTDFYAPKTTTCTFAPGQQRLEFRVPTLRDAGVPKMEGLETFRVIATPADRTLGTQTATVSIADYIVPPGVSITNVALNEGNFGASNAEFTITLDARYPKPVTVTYATADGTATAADSDFIPSTGTISFAPGELSKKITVSVTGDRKVELDETFQLVLTNSTNSQIARKSATCTIRNDEVNAPGFQIDLTFVNSPTGPVPSEVQALAREAAARWSRIIVGDLSSVTARGLFVDDFELTVQMGLLGGSPNGAGGAIANAAPTEFRAGPRGLPTRGITGLDPADVSDLTSASQRAWVIDVITHELGHALGFGAGFKPFDPFVAGNTFTGPNALREYRSAFRTTATSVPLEAGIRGHWDESVFGDELMTPYATSVGIPMPISRITVGALQDMGYTVSYSAAERYSPVMRAASFAAAMSSSATASNSTAFAGGTTRSRALAMSWLKA